MLLDNFRKKTVQTLELLFQSQNFNDLYMFLHAQVNSAKTHILHPIYFIHKSYCFWYNLPNNLGNTPMQFQ